MLTGAGLLTGKSHGRMRVGMLSPTPQCNACRRDVADTALKLTGEGKIISPVCPKHSQYLDEE